ncbi:aldehyde dehydrogenase [Desulforegula conservatrix]|uniref:aldehyde dehydrogenase n=1 Tax=Desulforegula conservatrix TaxID=153026 RepID=UPI00040ECD29|nr:aldehyde dehydrogenase [Desulforegula conservatrix]
MNIFEITKIIEKQDTFFKTGETRDIEFRKKQLTILKNAIISNEKKISEAIHLDLRRNDTEAYMTEIHEVLREIKFAIKNIEKWAKPISVSTPITCMPGRSIRMPEPLGKILIIAPWNYPFMLLMAPLVSSISSGNCSVLKPSEFAENTEKLIKEIITENFDPEFIAIICGGIEETKALLEEKFDHIFFTGSTQTGKAVMAAAARHLTPVTLELGGKSPCIIDETADIQLSARRIAWGKFMNAGQTCVAPDYLLVNENIKKPLMNEISKNIKKFYGDDPSKSDFYGRIINKRHFERVKSLIMPDKVFCGGDHDDKNLYISPTLLDKISLDDPVMKDEIFGPVLPVISWDKIDEAVDTVLGFPKPLALYFFSKDKNNVDRILKSTSSGNVCINDTIMQITSSHLPFGGVGESGMGSYHGKIGFDAFTHYKSVMKRSLAVDNPLRYPPQKQILKRVLKLL